MYIYISMYMYMYTYSYINVDSYNHISVGPGIESTPRTNTGTRSYAPQ